MTCFDSGRHPFFARMATLVVACVSLCQASERAYGLTAPSPRRLFITNNTYIGQSQQLLSANLDGSSPQVIALTQGGSLDVDVFQDHIYWTEGNVGRIRRASLDGSNAETLFQAEPTFPFAMPVGFSIDPAGERLYWSTQQANGMRSMKLDGSDQQVLNIAGLDTPYAVAVDGAQENLYWTDYRLHRIYRSNLDGALPTLIVQDSGDLPSGDGLALDLTGGKMYWTNRMLDTVQRANLDGSQRETIITTSGVGSNLRDIEIDPISQKLYWIDDRKDVSERSYVYRSNLDGSGRELLMELVGQASGIAISVPEPSALMLLGLAACGALHKRRQRRERRSSSSRQRL